MKIFKQIIVAILLIVPIYIISCSEDKGNYSYSELNEVYVDTVGQKTTFVVNQYETLEISPKLGFKLKERPASDFEYRWIIYPNSYNEANNAAIEELSTEKDLKVSITQEPLSIDYAVVLYITDKVTGLVSQMNYTVSVQASISSGIMVLHGQNKEYDLDYIATPNSVPVLETNRWFKNIISDINGDKIRGEHPFVATARRNNTAINHIYAGAEGQFMQLSGKDFTKQFEGSDLFKMPPSKIWPQAIAVENQIGRYYTVLINNNKLHNINNSISPAWDHMFSYELLPETSVDGGLNLAPYIYMNDQLDYTSNIGAIVFDNNSRKFLYIPKTNEEETKLKNFEPQQTIPDINNINKELIYMSKGYNGQAFCIFAEGASRDLYIIDFNKANIGLDENIQARRIGMDNLPEALSAQYYACGRNGNVFLYASSKNIYAIEYAGSGTAIKINDDFPAGEEITSIRIYNPEGMPALNDITGTIFYVATWNGSEGKVYEYKINRTSGRLENDRQPLNIFTGFGRVEDIVVKVQGTGLN